MRLELELLQRQDEGFDRLSLESALAAVAVSSEEAKYLLGAIRLGEKRPISRYGGVPIRRASRCPVSPYESVGWRS